MRTGVEERRAARHAMDDRVEFRIRSDIGRIAPGLVNAYPGHGLDREQLAQILSSVQNAFPKVSFKKISRKLRTILIKLKGKTEADVELPSPEVVTHRQASPFAADRFLSVPRLSQILQIYLDDLAANPDVDDETAAGRILFSSIAIGGLINRSLLEKLPGSIKIGMVRYENCCWLDLPLEELVEGNEGRVRRWFPDSLSTCLIAKWQIAEREWPRGGKGSVPSLINSLYARLGVSKAKDPPDPVPNLLVAANTRLRLYLPQLLVDFLSSDDRGQSVTVRSWWRILADWHLERPVSTASDQELADEICATAEPPEFDSAISRAETSSDPEAVLLLKKSLKWDGKFRKPKSASDSVRLLSETLGPMGPMFSALLDWSEWLLAIMSSGSRRAKSQSVYRYLNSFAHELIAVAGELDPRSASAEALQERYQELLGSIRSTKEHTYAASRLREFHSFLVLTRETPPVEIEGVFAARGEVRCNVISETEYQRTLALIDRLDSDKRTCAMRRAMLILAYRTGLRRGELAHLRLEDIHENSVDSNTSKRPLLWIHSHPDASLKTDQSLRRLPLAHLLSPDELKELFEWKRIRRIECGSIPYAASLIFCEYGQHSQRLPEDEIDVLVTLLRYVCNDDSIVLHTLRHSALSHLFARLFTEELSRSMEAPLSCPWVGDMFGSQSLVSRLFSTTALPREAAYLLSTIAGHLDPTETMNTYVHFQDWIAGHYVNFQLESLPLSFWASLEGVGTDSLMVRHSRFRRRNKAPLLVHQNSSRHVAAKLREQKPDGFPAVTSPSPINTRPDTRHQLERLPLEGVYCLLALANRSMSETAREHVSGIGRIVFGRLRRAALEMAQTKTASRNVAARRSRFLAEHAPRRRPPISRLPQLDGYGPAIPREKSERKDARDVFRRATAANSSVDAGDLGFLLERTSHTDSVVVVKSLEDLKRVASILSRLGMPRRRISLQIRTLPRSKHTLKGWKKTLATTAGLPINSAGLAADPIKVARSERLNPAGVVAVQIWADRTEPNLKGQSAEPPKVEARKLAYGWRIGLYYALCVKRAIGPVSPQDASASGDFSAAKNSS